ncbi:MAG TPA: hypothetical protein VGK73_02885 [Polyangiaceae bacterium]
MNLVRGLAPAAWLGVAGLLGFACQAEEERPPPQTCLGVQCFMHGNPGAKPGDGSGGSAGGSDGDGGEAPSVTLSGVVGHLLDDEFAYYELYEGEVDLRAESSDSGSERGVWRGSEPFTIRGVRQAPFTWLYGEPRVSSLGALPTLKLIRTDEPNSDGVVFLEEGNAFILVRESIIEQIFGVLSSPITLDSRKGQVVLQLLTASGAGASGIQVTAPKADVVIYAVNGSFSEIPEETDSTGLVLLANVDGDSWPGELVEVGFQGDRSTAFDVRVITGAVTYAQIAP